MSVRVEFLGMPRQYAGCNSADFDATALDELLIAIADTFPEVGKHCFDGATLRSGYLVGVNSRFDASKAGRILEPGDTVQLLSADVGGA